MPRALTESEALELEALLTAQFGGPTLDAFIRQHWPHQVPPRHLAPLICLFEAARLSPIQVALSMPPGHAKSITIKRAIAWWLSHTPADLCAYATHSESKAHSESRRIRQMARQVGVALADDMQNVHEWRTKYDGGLVAVGSKGLTGHRVQGLLVVDDPYQDRADAESIAVREAVWEWFGEVVLTRREGASAIVIHTRWTPDDLIGRLSKLPDWVVINLPAFAEEGDPIGRAPGEALWPEMYPAEKLDAIRHGPGGDWSFAALFQGRPSPRGHRVFGDAHHYDSLPEGCRYVIGCDPAATASTRADWSVAVVLATRGHGRDMTGYVVDVVRRQVEVPDFVATLRSLSSRYSARVVVEAVGGFKAVPQLLRRLDPRLDVREAKLAGDKFVRAQGAAAAWNGGRLLLPKSAPWLSSFLAEAADFTGVGDAHDDQIDALSHAWTAAATNPPAVAPDLDDLTRSPWLDLVF